MESVEFTVATFALVFGAVFALDFVWARYTAAIAQDRIAPASFYGVGTILLSGSAAIGYTHNPLLLIPAGIGSLLGTSVSMWLARRGRCTSGN